MITIAALPERFDIVHQEYFRPWRASCLCGWSEDVGWQSDAEELGRDHWNEANCDW